MPLDRSWSTAQKASPPPSQRRDDQLFRSVRSTFNSFFFSSFNSLMAFLQTFAPWKGRVDVRCSAIHTQTLLWIVQPVAVRAKPPLEVGFFTSSSTAASTEKKRHTHTHTNICIHKLQRERERRKKGTEVVNRDEKRKRTTLNNGEMDPLLVYTFSRSAFRGLRPFHGLYLVFFCFFFL